MLRWLGSKCRVVVEKSFGQHLYRTNTVTCGLLLAVGDVIQQKLEKSMNKRTTYDWKRTGRMFVVGVAQGPAHHFWYTKLDRLLPKKDLKTISLKILADQLIAAPFFASTFILGMGILQDKKLTDCFLEFVKKFPTIYLFDWCIWPPTQYINFLLISPAFRVFYVNVVTVVWDVFLSWVKHYDELEEGKEGGH